MVRKKPAKKKRSPRIVRKRAEARRDILSAAQAILAEQGADAVTLASVAARLDITKQALYHYFPSKEAMNRALVASLIEAETEALVRAVGQVRRRDKVLGELIRAFYAHYIGSLDAFRAVYCQSQLTAPATGSLDEATLRQDIHPHTRRLFDTLEAIIAGDGATVAKRRHARRQAFAAWASALGLMTMIGLAEATHDPLVHGHDSLLNTLARAFELPRT
ncbi:MAG: TetR/AcrR family transcriptional regulator [Gammaproteobacteria bacterium]|nr:TetR/AcrR family transcriptional regulator [Gammaproteobacteria bacterium]